MRPPASFGCYPIGAIRGANDHYARRYTPEFWPGTAQQRLGSISHDGLVTAIGDMLSAVVPAPLAIETEVVPRSATSFSSRYQLTDFPLTLTSNLATDRINHQVYRYASPGGATYSVFWRRLKML